MLKLKIADYEIEIDEEFPPYFKATDEQLESALFDSDCWDDSTGMIDGTQYYCILTFDDIKKDFEGWTPEERAEYLGDDDTPEYDVHDWIRDCMMNSLSVIKSIHLRSSVPNTPTVTKPVFNDIPFAGEAVATKDGKVIWTNNISGDCPPDIALLYVQSMYVVDGVCVFELTDKGE